MGVTFPSRSLSVCLPVCTVAKWCKIGLHGAKRSHTNWSVTFEGKSKLSHAKLIRNKHRKLHNSLDLFEERKMWKVCLPSGRTAINRTSPLWFVLTDAMEPRMKISTPMHDLFTYLTFALRQFNIFIQNPLKRHRSWNIRIIIAKT